LGYELDKTKRYVGQFIDWLDQTRPGQDIFTVADAVEWSCLPHGQPGWHGARLSSLRCWADYAHAHDPAIPVIPSGLLPASHVRSVPYIYKDAQIIAIMDQFAQTATSGRTPRCRWAATTYQTLTGFLACTGARVGEALTLNLKDFDQDTGWITITSGKTRRERLILLHRTAITALTAYLDHLDRPENTRTPDSPLFVSGIGTRVIHANFHYSFHEAVLDVGLPDQGQARPRIHDLRHTFAVNQIMAAYHDGADPARRLSLLSTWLGHVSPTSTYWYLTATPELLGAAARLLDQSQQEPR
jgi:integrase